VSEKEEWRFVWLEELKQRRRGMEEYTIICKSTLGGGGLVVFSQIRNRGAAQQLVERQLSFSMLSQLIGTCNRMERERG
jgi:hypothetical protein